VPEGVDETIHYTIQNAGVERLDLAPTGEFEIIQHIELRESPVHITEYRLAVYQDAAGNRCLPNCPERKGPIFGPRLLAMIGWMKSVARCSYSTLEICMEDVLQVPVSRGYLTKLCTGTISASLADPYKELAQAIPRQEQLSSDETSIKDDGKKSLDLVRYGDHVQPVCHRRFAVARGFGEVGRSGIQGLSEFRLLLGQLLLRLE